MFIAFLNDIHILLLICTLLQPFVSYSWVNAFFHYFLHGLSRHYCSGRVKAPRLNEETRDKLHVYENKPVIFYLIGTSKYPHFAVVNITFVIGKLYTCKSA